MPGDHQRGEVLEAVYELGRSGPDEVAAHAGLSPARLDDVLTGMAADGLVATEADEIRLTPAGERAAVAFIRKHRLAERLLRDVLGLEWWKIHLEARRWDDVISDDVEQRLVEALGDPGTCPHGNPIPGSANCPDQSAAVTLAVAPAGTCRVVRITEELEEDDDALRLLEDAGIIPGRMAEVLGREADGTVKVVGPVADTVVPPHVAARTYVEAVGD